jgi:hypothetical protein
MTERFLVFWISSIKQDFPANMKMDLVKKSWDVNNTKSPLNSSIGFLHCSKFNLEKKETLATYHTFQFDNKYSTHREV